MLKTLLIYNNSDNRITDLVKSVYINEGVEVEKIDSLSTSFIDEYHPDLLILDFDFPDKKNIDLCRTANTIYGGPILVIAPQTSIAYEPVILENGADLFITKPITPDLLSARINSLLKLYQKNHERVSLYGSEGHFSNEPANIVSLGKLAVNKQQRSVRYGNNDITLTSAEFDLLWILVCRANQIVSRDEIYSLLFNIEYDGLDRCADIRISRLRRKFGPDGKRLIKSIRSEGYLLAI